MLRANRHGTVLRKSRGDQLRFGVGCGALVVRVAMAQERGSGGTAAVIASAASVPLGDASFLRAVLEAIPAFVVRIDPEQRISYINHLRSGVKLEEVIGRPVRDLIAPEDFLAYERAIEQALRTGEPCAYMARGSRSVTPRGAAYYASHAVAIDNGDGRRAVCIVATDVSEHLARADELAESEERLRIAVEATGIGLWSWDLASDRLEWDQRLIDLAGCAPPTAREYAERLVHPDDRARVFGEIESANAGHPAFPEHRIVRPDGEIRWVLPCGRVTMDESGRVVRLRGGLVDVTAQRRTAEHLRDAQKLDAIGSLTAGVAHNFNNMLAVILPALELSLSGGASPPREMLEDALHAAQRAKELVQQLMTFAGQRRPPAVAAYDLAPILERTVSMCRRTFERQIRIESTIERRDAAIACDPTAIEQMVVNFLINARDAVTEAGRADPRIVVELSSASAAPPHVVGGSPRRYARIRVADNGVGMDDEVKRRLFEPFFTTKESGRGTGLGLATSYAIARDHGGFITFESKRGVGTRISIFLPQSEGADGHSRVAPAKDGTAGRRGKILVIDDEPAMHRVARVVLGERGHDVYVAEDGERAVAALDGGLVPDLVLLDRSLPGWPVKLTLGEIRKRVGATPVLFFTGQDVTKEDREDVQDVLYKPLSMEELVRSVEEWLVLGS